MKIIPYDSLEPGALLMRSMQSNDVSAAVSAIVQDVAERGDAALLAYAERFDRAKLSSLTPGSCRT